MLGVLASGASIVGVPLQLKGFRQGSPSPSFSPGHLHWPTAPAAVRCCYVRDTACEMSGWTPMRLLLQTADCLGVWMYLSHIYLST